MRECDLEHREVCVFNIKLVSVLTGLMLEKMYELFVGTNKTVRYIWVSIDRGSTVRLLILNQMQVLLPVGRVLHRCNRDQGFNSPTSLASITKTIFFHLILQTAFTNSPFSYRV